MKDIIEFLKLNGFKKTGVDRYSLSDCNLYLHPDNYEVCHFINEEEFSWYSSDLTIYTLIGYLTYYGLMDRNFKTK